MLVFSFFRIDDLGTHFFFEEAKRISFKEGIEKKENEEKKKGRISNDLKN